MRRGGLFWLVALLVITGLSACASVPMGGSQTPVATAALETPTAEPAAAETGVEVARAGERVETAELERYAFYQTAVEQPYVRAGVPDGWIRYVIVRWTGSAWEVSPPIDTPNAPPLPLAQGVDQALVLAYPDGFVGASLVNLVGTDPPSVTAQLDAVTDPAPWIVIAPGLGIVGQGTGVPSDDDFCAGLQYNGPCIYYVNGRAQFVSLGLPPPDDQP